MSRPSISERLKQIGSVVQENAAQLAAGAVSSWMVDHREELLLVIQHAQNERGAELLRELCKRVPLAAVFIQMAMTGSPDDAIDRIGLYDAELGKQLKRHRGNVIKLQEYWKAGAR